DLNLIENTWVEAAGGDHFEVVNPANDAVLATVPDGGREDARAAIAAASRALPGWSSLPANQRAKPLASPAALMLRDQERLASLMTAEQGKPLAEARGEIAYAASFI